MKSLAKKFEFPFIKKEKIATDTYTFYFDRVKPFGQLRASGGYAEDFDFIPGQYIKLYLQIENPDVRGSSRYFTISSNPTDRKFLTITTKIIKSSFKKKLHSLKSGERVSFFGPIGYFTFNSKSKKPKIFLAGGIGITPFHSILTSLDYKQFKSNILLIVSFSKIEDVIFYEELRKIEKENPNIQIIYTLTKEKFDGFENGRIDKEMILKYCPDYKKSEFFIVGSVAFEGNFLVILKEMGIKEKNIFSENFPGY